MSGRSIATIKSPEFINLQPSDISPLISQCEIKVLYVGKNRNHSFITKEVATDMAKTLRGAPIVGWYAEDKEDFRDHGNELIWNGDGIKFNVKTKPYGFVAPDSKVWFQEFEDTDEFGNKETREYLMTTGYLWTEQYEEAKKVIEEGRPHSMELDEKTLDGHWSEDSKSGIEFFIISDAIFSKLCILGEDVEPCFEGSTVTAPDISKNFSKEENFSYKTLFEMMNQLKYALEQKGGEKLSNQVEDPKAQAGVETEFEKTPEQEPEKVEEYKKEEDEQRQESKDDSSEDSDSDTSKEEDEKKKKAQNALEEQYSLLSKQYEALTQQCEELLAFKKDIDTKKKQELINSFYMLSNEDKKDVRDNIDKYSLDEIESKLSVICFRKKVSFDLDTEERQEDVQQHDNPGVTFNLENAGEQVPAWVKRVKDRKQSKEV